MNDVLVLMSTYNGEHYVEEQIKSILAQKDCIVSLLIRDDGSKDQTKELLNRYAHLENVQVIFGEVNLRPAMSFLTMLKNSDEHSYYAFADQDDVWDEDKLICGISMIQQEEIPALYCANARVVGAELQDLGRNVYTKPKCTNFESVLMHGNFLGCTMVFNNRLAKYIKQYPLPEYCIMHDSYLSWLCVLIGGIIKYDSQSHMRYRQHGENSVGVCVSNSAKLMAKLQNFFGTKQHKIDRQAEILLNIYENVITNTIYLRLICNYRKGIREKWKLMMNSEACYESIWQHIETVTLLMQGKL